jgi:hypothetical protein
VKYIQDLCLPTMWVMHCPILDHVIPPVSTCFHWNWKLNLVAIPKDHRESTKGTSNHEDNQGKGPTHASQDPQEHPDVQVVYLSDSLSSNWGKLSGPYPKPKKGKPKDAWSYNYPVDENGSRKTTAGATSKALFQGDPTGQRRSCLLSRRRHPRGSGSHGHSSAWT